MLPDKGAFGSLSMSTKRSGKGTSTVPGTKWRIRTVFTLVSVLTEFLDLAIWESLIVLQDDYARFRELNVTAEMSPAMFFQTPIAQGSEGLMEWDFATMIKNQILVTIGSDCYPDSRDLNVVLPACARILDGVMKVMPDPEAAKEEAAETICRMLTVAGADAVNRRDTLGNIETGKTANFVVVDRDLSRGEFEGAQILTTYFEGYKV